MAPVLPRVLCSKRAISLAVVSGGSMFYLFSLHHKVQSPRPIGRQSSQLVMRGFLCLRRTYTQRGLLRALTYGTLVEVT